jgi:hypothetical protein
MYQNTEPKTMKRQLSTNSHQPKIKYKPRKLDSFLQQYFYEYLSIHFILFDKSEQQKLVVKLCLLVLEYMMYSLRIIYRY